MRRPNESGPYLVVGPSMRVKYSCKSLKEANKFVEEELNCYPDGECAIFKVVARASRKVGPVEYENIGNTGPSI